MSSEKTITEGLLRQFKSSWKMLRTAIENVPDEKWHDGSEGWFFSMTAYHFVETMEFYIGNDPDAMKWGKRAGYNWDHVKDIEKDILPLITKELVNSYLDDMEKTYAKAFSSMTLDELAGKDGFHWFTSVYEKLVYLLRHNMHHQGELSRTLSDWGCKRAKWV